MTIYLFHGTGGTPNDFWFPWLKNTLEKSGNRVFAPFLPNADAPDLSVWSAFLQENYTINENDILIGHSAGAPLILDYLNRYKDTQIKQAILVAGFINPLPHYDFNDTTQLKNMDWQNIRQRCASFVYFNAKNDPWGCDDTQAHALHAHLDGKMIIDDNEGHYGSTTYDAPYPEFKRLLEKIDL